MFNLPHSEIDIKERSPLVLAYLGDAVLELLTRSHLISQSRSAPKLLHKQNIAIVSARAQFAVLPLITAILSEKELSIFRSGRNANKAAVSKNASAEEYRASTGIEALFGWLYLEKQEDRVCEIFAVIWRNYLDTVTSL
jgi:ribonuclease-3 family protein